VPRSLYTINIFTLYKRAYCSNRKAFGLHYRQLRILRIVILTQITFPLLDKKRSVIAQNGNKKLILKAETVEEERNQL